jgi:hypothetical protein
MAWLSPSRAHALSWLLTGALLLAAILAAGDMWRVLPAYAVIAAGLQHENLLGAHLKFVGFVTLPLLVALLLIWVVIAPLALQGSSSNLGYAFAVWAKIAASGGLFQLLLIPPVNHPMRLRRLLQQLRAPAAAGVLITSPVILLPDVRRRLGQIVDARRAQGASVSGLAGLISAPTFLAPLVASLLESSLSRAELWDHRRFLDRPLEHARYSWLASVLGPVFALGTLAASTWGSLWS